MLLEREVSTSSAKYSWTALGLRSLFFKSVRLLPPSNAQILLCLSTGVLEIPCCRVTEVKLLDCKRRRVEYITLL